MCWSTTGFCHWISKLQALCNSFRSSPSSFWLSFCSSPIIRVRFCAKPNKPDKVLWGASPTGCTEHGCVSCGCVLVLYVSQQWAFVRTCTNKLMHEQCRQTGRAGGVFVSSERDLQSAERVFLFVRDRRQADATVVFLLVFLAAALGRNGYYWLRVMSPFQTTATKRLNLSEATEILSI